MPRKGENIYKRKDGRWEGRYIKDRTPDGKAIYGYLYAHSYRDLKSKMIATKQKETISEKKETVAPDKTILFGELTDMWLNTAKIKIKDSTYVKYNNLLNAYILPELKDIHIQELSYSRIEEFANKLLTSGGKKKMGLSAKTVNDNISLIRTILRYAQNHGIPINSLGNGIAMKCHTKELCVLSLSEQKNLCGYLMENMDSKNLGILICLLTGLRIGEICALRWEDISLSEKSLYVHSTLQRIQDFSDDNQKKTKISISSPKSQCSIRTIPLTDDIVSLIFSVFPNQSGFVLTGDDKCFVEQRSMQNHFKRVCIAASISIVNFHALRHTFATRCIEVGFDVKSLSEILGHANVTITMNRYVHPSMDVKRENMSKLAELFAVNN